MFSFISLLVLASSSTTLARPSPDGYIPTNMPLNTSTTNSQNNPAMFLHVFDSAEDPCTNQSATLYPNIPELQAPTGSCVNADSINTNEVTCVKRLDDAGRMDFTIWTCPLISYAAVDCNGPSQDISWQSELNGWILPNGGAKSFQFACYVGNETG